jgi:deoxyribodipyrimidine photo-lyase
MQKTEKENKMEKKETSTAKLIKVENGLFVFRRDLRIVDNRGLEQLKTMCHHIYTIFIFTPEQVSKSNSFKSKNAVQFMIESLVDLSKQIDQQGGKLYCFYGKNEQIVNMCINKWNIGVVGFNKDYTPYALARDEKITKLCDEKRVSTIITPDYYLYEPGTILSASNQPYQKFTPFYETCLRKPIELPKKTHSFSFQKSNASVEHIIHFEEAFRKFVGKPNPHILVSGGRENAIKKIRDSMTTQQRYEPTRNDLSYQTSELSAYIKFGCVSIREVYKSFHRNKAFVRQLIWRDFYMNILYSFPHVLSGPMKPSYKGIHWRTSERRLNAWKKGETGFPVVDAGMRQMNETGYMHNRARLIVSSFLVKTLLIDWQEGEKYFAQMLVDYDPASNNGNWQWTAGTGADSQPYFRIFNPWEQAKHYDSECGYIKRWIPELRDVPVEDILRWNESCLEYKKRGVRYPCPMVDYSTQKEEALEMYRSVFH